MPANGRIQFPGEARVSAPLSSWQEGRQISDDGKRRAVGSSRIEAMARRQWNGGRPSTGARQTSFISAGSMAWGPASAESSDT